MIEPIEILNVLTEAARSWDEKYYREWVKLDGKEFPPFDENGQYVPKHFHDKKPSAELEAARQIYLAAHSFLRDVERAKHSFEQFKAHYLNADAR